MPKGSRLETLSICSSSSSEAEEEHLSSTNSSSERHPHGEPKESAPLLAEKENKLVFYSRTLVACVLVITTAIVAWAVYYFVSNEEEKDFETQFMFASSELLDASNQNARNIEDFMKMYSDMITSASVTMNTSWPNFTLPDFEVFGSSARKLSGALLLAFAPLVTSSQRAGWESYSVNQSEWITEGLEYLGKPSYSPSVMPYIYKRASRASVPESGSGPHSPLWQLSPAPHQSSIVNFNLQSVLPFQRLASFTAETRTAAISEVLDTSLFFGTNVPLPADSTGNDPQSLLVQPVFERINDPTSAVVGHVMAVIPWRVFFENTAQEGQNGIICVLRESCGQSFTYRIDGPNATFVGSGDQHESEYASYEQQADFATLYKGDMGVKSDQCMYTLEIYPSDEMQEDNTTNRPMVFTIAVICIFGFATLVFVLYDFLVEQRQSKVMATAARSTAIVSSLFPANVRDQLQQQAEEEERKRAERRKANNMLENGDAGYEHDDDILETKPIADLFPSATVLFADIAGFTAWSSVREPSQVFVLLETIYRAFDKIAKQRGVFKVETIGDCYVAVCGLPEPRKDHAVVMAKFAADIMSRMTELCTQKLESKLGPDTGELAMRIGLHSGPVTAGVLRGERARFQLFGDTVNTASRMESTGLRHNIHISQETADLLVAAGKEHWLKSRDDLVVAKGKGAMKTYWLSPKSSDAASSANTPSENVSVADGVEFSEDLAPGIGQALAEPAQLQKTQRMIDWNTDILYKLLQAIEAKQVASGESARPTIDARLECNIGQNGTVLDEVQEIIEMPKFDSAAYSRDASLIVLNIDVKAQLRSYITIIASMYRDNAFHNFEHASHVAMSTVKLLARIVAPTNSVRAESDLPSEQLHDYTFGITSDPLTQFGCVFAALVHDVDHRGVPNFQLQKEDATLAAVYRNKSVAEQNSVDVAWDLLMDPQFDKLRLCIYHNKTELLRFRHLVINSVMATDIFDKELKALRDARWEKAFSNEQSFSATSSHRKATIVIEHLIQASDVSHTMQHWHVYTKWNERLFREMYTAYLTGRSDKNPADGWYNGELWFFDNYVIPLAKKLKECGVFGVSSDEYLSYAQKNRSEWEVRGKECVEGFVKRMTAKVRQANAAATKQEEVESARFV